MATATLRRKPAYLLRSMGVPAKRSLNCSWVIVASSSSEGSALAGWNSSASVVAARAGRFQGQTS